jgi:hypothetical protein
MRCPFAKSRSFIRKEIICGYFKNSYILNEYIGVFSKCNLNEFSNLLQETNCLIVVEKDKLFNKSPLDTAIELQRYDMIKIMINNLNNQGYIISEYRTEYDKCSDHYDPINDEYMSHHNYISLSLSEYSKITGDKTLSYIVQPYFKQKNEEI